MLFSKENYLLIDIFLYGRNLIHMEGVTSVSAL